MSSAMESWRTRRSRARKLTVGAAVVSVGAVVVAIVMPVTILSWCLGAVAGAAAMAAIGAARRTREVADEMRRREAEREALVAEQRRARAVQAQALARLDSRPPPSSGPISTSPPSGPVSSVPSAPFSSAPSAPTSSAPAGPVSSNPAVRTLPSAPPQAAATPLGYDVPRDRPSVPSF